MQEQRQGIKGTSQSQRGPASSARRKWDSASLRVPGSVVINYYDYDYFSRTLVKDKEEERGSRRGLGWAVSQVGGKEAPLILK